MKNYEKENFKFCTGREAGNCVELDRFSGFHAVEIAGTFEYHAIHTYTHTYTYTHSCTSRNHVVQ